MKYDLVVIGGGPAGYVGAIRAAQLGKRVACVENDRAGGTCLNWGCIPTKSLLRNAEIYQLLTHRIEEFGIAVEGLSFDWSKVIQRSRKTADKLAGGVEFLLKKNKIDYVRGTGALSGAGQVSVDPAEGDSTTLDAGEILISTGCATRELPGLPINGKSVIGSRDAMTLSQPPKDMIIIGAGAIGVEFAYFYNAFGVKVTLVEMMPAVLPVEDEEISKVLERSFKKQGIRTLTGTKVAGTRDHGDHVEITVEGASNETLSAEVCLVAIGVSPVLPQSHKPIQLDERGFIRIDERYRTSLPNVYAAGDVIGPPWLAHTASYEAIQAVEGIFVEGHTPRKVGVFPGCTYCHPQVASAGLTAQAAKEKGLKYRVGKFPFSASGKALAVGEPEGFVKLIFGDPHGEILGAHIVGDNATELIGELGLAMELEATWEEIEATIHAHPTLSEAIHEAAGAAFDKAIHI
ncbi:MAG TPA: dihydrolipoyl dehydrogenase [Verrucomicrobiales bacterium]|nr:dihydrolipoyl dehydrogenase [Verrucomicrobiales bacterium]